MKTIYDLKLHEFFVDKGMFIIRVPGGWIYQMRGTENQCDHVFVPYNNEFEGKEETR